MMTIQQTLDRDMMIAEADIPQEIEWPLDSGEIYPCVWEDGGSTTELTLSGHQEKRSATMLIRRGLFLNKIPQVKDAVLFDEKKYRIMRPTDSADKGTIRFELEEFDA